MGDATTDNRIVATRCSRLACAGRSGCPVSVDFIYHESVATSAESLETLAKIFAAYPKVEMPDLGRVRHLRERLAPLIGAAKRPGASIGWQNSGLKTRNPS